MVKVLDPTMVYEGSRMSPVCVRKAASLLGRSWTQERDTMVAGPSSRHQSHTGHGTSRVTRTSEEKDFVDLRAWALLLGLERSMVPPGGGASLKASVFFRGRKSRAACTSRNLACNSERSWCGSRKSSSSSSGCQSDFPLIGSKCSFWAMHRKWGTQEVHGGPLVPQTLRSHPVLIEFLRSEICKYLKCYILEKFLRVNS